MIDLQSDSPATTAPRPGSRRNFLAAAGVALAAPMLMLPRRVQAAAAPRALTLHHTHTGETLTQVYAQGDRYLPDGLSALSRFLRDFRTSDVHAIDPLLFDQMHVLAAVTGGRSAFQVISGYRSPATNRGLRSHSTGVADRSLHLEGRAIDIRLPGVPLADLHAAALSLKVGGVGYYPDSDFIHVDTGRVRHW